MSGIIDAVRAHEGFECAPEPGDSILDGYFLGYHTSIGLTRQHVPARHADAVASMFRQWDGHDPVGMLARVCRHIMESSQPANYTAPPEPDPVADWERWQNKMQAARTHLVRAESLLSDISGESTSHLDDAMDLARRAIDTMDRADHRPYDGEPEYDPAEEES